MQLTIDSKEPLDRVLQVVGSLYGVQLTVEESATPAARPRADQGRRGSGTARAGAAERASGRGRSPEASPAPAPRGSRRGRAGAAGAPAARLDTAALRTWARENGHAVRDRGRIPAAVVAAYEQSVGRSQ
jgi:Lsr2